MLIATPARELRQVVEHTLAVGMKDVRTIDMNSYAVSVERVVRVAADMRSPVDQQNPMTARGQLLRADAA